MKKSDLITLLIIFAAIIALSFLAYRYFGGFQESLSQINLPGFKPPQLDLNLGPEENRGDKEFISPDGRLELKYPANFIEMEKGALEGLNQEMIEIEKAEVLLFAYQFKMKESGFSFLVVQKLNLEENLKEIIEKMKESIEKKGGEMEIFNLKTEGEEAEFETRYKPKGGNIFYSKEKIILTEGGNFTVAVFALEKDWPKTIGDANSILDSVRTIE